MAVALARRPRRIPHPALAGVAVLLVIAAFAAGVGLRPSGHDAISHRFAAGGFGLTLPQSWAETAVQPHQPHMWFRAERRTLAGVATGWLWVNRFTASESSEKDALDYLKSRGVRRVDVDEVRVGEWRGRRLRYDSPKIPFLSQVPGAFLPTIAYHVRAFGHVYQLGVAGWPRLPRDDAEQVFRSLRLFEATGWRTVVRAADRFEVGVPAQWNGQVDWLRAPGAVYGAFSPEPVDSWMYVIRMNAATINESVTTATRNLQAAGGRILSRADTTIAGRSAVRLDFLFPNSEPRKPPMAHDVEWFVDDGHGRVLVLAVGRNDPASTIADDIAATFRLR